MANARVSAYGHDTTECSPEHAREERVRQPAEGVVHEMALHKRVETRDLPRGPNRGVHHADSPAHPATLVRVEPRLRDLRV